jgi:hypothetical protein
MNMAAMAVEQTVIIEMEVGVLAAAVVAMVDLEEAMSEVCNFLFLSPSFVPHYKLIEFDSRSLIIIV